MPFDQSTTGAAIKAANTAPVAGDPALVVAISPNSVNANGQATNANSAPVVLASGQTFSGQNQTPSQALLAGGEYNASPTTITSGNASPLQLDNAGNLLVNIKAGAGSGGTAIADEAAFTEGTTNTTPISGEYNSSPSTLSSGHVGAAQVTANRKFHAALNDGTGTPITSTGGAIDVNVKSGGNNNGRAVPSSSAPVVLASQIYETVAASQTSAVLGSTGATGDWIEGFLVNPGSTTPGNVTLIDNSTTVMTFAFGTLADTRPFYVPFGALSKSGAWNVTTGTNVSIAAFGNFT